MDVTQQEWLDWRAMKVSKEFLKRLFEKREDLKEGLAEGQAENKDVVIGQCQAYKDAVDYGLLKFETVDSEEFVNVS